MTRIRRVFGRRTVSVNGVRHRVEMRAHTVVVWKVGRPSGRREVPLADLVCAFTGQLQLAKHSDHD